MKSKCTLCPRNCGADRFVSVGMCGESDTMRISLAQKHYFEEPCISGTDGTGAIFFVGCGLGCIYCQNRDISSSPVGAKTVSPQQLSGIMLDLLKQKAHGIDLVTGTHFTPQIAEALRIARQNGLDIPVIWNSSGYELPETLMLLDGLVDVYLPDFKYANCEKAKKYSNAPDYPHVAVKAIEYMLSSVGRPVFDKDGMIKRGVIVRHLLLPGNVIQSKQAIKTLFDRFGNDICYSIMRQYTPISSDLPVELRRCVFDREYVSLVDYALSLGIERGFIQDKGCEGTEYIPDFKNSSATSP